MRRECPVRLLELSWSWVEPAVLQKNQRFALQIELHRSGLFRQMSIRFARPAGQVWCCRKATTALDRRQVRAVQRERKRQSRNNQLMTEVSGVLRFAEIALKVRALA